MVCFNNLRRLFFLFFAVGVLFGYVPSTKSRYRYAIDYVFQIRLYLSSLRDYNFPITTRLTEKNKKKIQCRCSCAIDWKWTDLIFVCVISQRTFPEGFRFSVRKLTSSVSQPLRTCKFRTFLLNNRSGFIPFW